MKIRLLITLVITLCIILVVYSSVKDKGSRYNETKRAIALRKIAHEVLLLSGDSTSKVLPVKQVSADEFHIYPENTLSVTPDSFVNIVKRVAWQYNLPQNFTANIIKYQQEEPVYGLDLFSFNKDNTTASCMGRELPKDRYYLSFVFSNQGGGLFTTPWPYVACAVVLLSVLFFYPGKKKKQAPDAFLTEQNADGKYIAIGRYLFDAGQQYLELNGEKTLLTIKESKVLHILAAAPNMIIERETLQKEVWENEGVIVTRSLDMFISKLRKKLAGDPDVKIVNVHGKGYKLSVLS